MKNCSGKNHLYRAIYFETPAATIVDDFYNMYNRIMSMSLHYKDQAIHAAKIS